MSTRKAFHDFIDGITDENLVKRYFDLIKSIDKKTSGKLWKNLNAEEQEEVLRSYVESFNERQLVANEEVKTDLVNRFCYNKISSKPIW